MVGLCVFLFSIFICTFCVYVFVCCLVCVFGLAGMMDCCCCFKTSPAKCSYRFAMCSIAYLFVLICLILSTRFGLYLVCAFLLLCVHMCMVILCVFLFVY